MAITVQMPVYKACLFTIVFRWMPNEQESLDSVIMPTIESLKKAMTTFERQGGTVNVIICDDGLQLVSEDDRHRRMEFYSKNNIAYVARPGHGQDGFQRFKQAGNLNYCNTLSLRVEDLMDEMRVEILANEDKGMELWSEEEDRRLYEVAHAKAVEESAGRTWTAGNVRM
jgi:hypothetical protein